ncbi:hypothetical protein Tco_0457939 [Tanacetum coccineum]
MAFRNFMKKPSQSPSFSVRPADQPIDVGIPSVDPLRVVVDNDQVESSHFSKDKDVSGFELAIIGECVLGQDDDVAEGSKKRRLITKALEEEAIVVRPKSKKKKTKVPRRMSARGSVHPLPAAAPKGVGKHHRVLARYIRNLASNSDSLAPNIYQRAHSAHNMIYGLHYPLLRDKLGFLTFDELVNVYDVHALYMAVVGNMLTNESRIMSQGHSKLKNDLVSLKSKKSLLEHEMSKLEDQLSRAQKNQDVERSQVVRDLRFENARTLEELSMMWRVAASAEESRKNLFEELDGLQPRLREAERLGQRCQDLEWERDFLLNKSKEVTVLSSKLEATQLEKAKLKAITFGRSRALMSAWALVTSRDFIRWCGYHPEAKKIFDEAAEAFYRLKFPYVSLLVEKAGQSFEELAAVEAPAI